MNTGGSDLTATTASDNAKFTVSALTGRISPGEMAWLLLHILQLMKAQILDTLLLPMMEILVQTALWFRGQVV